MSGSEPGGGRGSAHRRGAGPIGGAMNAEWTKLWTVQSTGWLVLAIVALTVGIGLAMTGTLNSDGCGTPCPEDTVRLSLFGVRLSQAGVVVLAVLAVGNEYATGMVHTSVMALPRRAWALAGKFAVVAGTVLVAATVAVGASLLVGRWMLPGRGFTAANGHPALSLADEPTRRAALGTVLYLVLVALLSAGAAVLVRDTAGAITGVLVLLYVAPLVAALVSNARWQRWLHRYSPMDAGLAVQVTRHLEPQDIGPWAGLGVLAVYAAVAVVAALVMFEVRDA
ncbi:ABC transporter permease [Dactylosporangium sucinum]|uniref:ABC transporter permease n=1 Tax=Dactylosporangium sucinum TaxID=1424081 RepID=A0A917T4D9_9ACTN|nr:ABC transporter permease [Dactylosporangium sucinum]GGM08792.1 ABC transporter permease [Dactylosporangium sucinum]